jgi:hypothetical protein
MDTRRRQTNPDSGDAEAPPESFDQPSACAAGT